MRHIALDAVLFGLAAFVLFRMGVFRRDDDERR